YAVPAEVPDATQCDRESKHRRNSSQPTPAGGTGHLHAEAEPRQQPELQGEKCSTDYQRGSRRWPSIRAAECRSVSRMVIRHTSSSCNDDFTAASLLARYSAMPATRLKN